MPDPTHAPKRSLASLSAIAAAVLLTAAFMPCRAQETSTLRSLEPGMRIRIVASDSTPKKVMGTVRTVDAESVSIEVPGREVPISIARKGIASLDVSEGRRSRWVDAAIGAGLGAAAGAGAGAALSSSQGGGHLVSTGAVAGFCGVLGAGIGALVGAAIPPGEHWHRMQASGYRLSIVPRMDRDIGFNVSLGF